MKNNKLARSVAMALLGFAAHTLAQAADLQGGTPPQPKASDAEAVPQLKLEKSLVTQDKAGPSVTLHEVLISGNKFVATSALRAQVGSVESQSFDMAGLNALADKLADYYHASGYPFAQVYLPPQDLKGGVLKINVLEGTYGIIKGVGKDGLGEGAQPFLDYGLLHGDPIANKQLERTMLILDDQPGLKIRPVIKPGAAQGEADLTVNVRRESYVSGDVGIDNTGPLSTGRNRLHAAADFNSPFRYGDKISLNAMVTNEHMRLGSIDYETPLGVSGLRGKIGYAHTSYVLGGQFASLDAQGIANVTSAKLTYPLVRSQALNVFLSVGVEHKKLEDDYRAAGIVRSKSSNGIPVGLQFDKRDALLGGGVTYGMLTWVHGKLNLDGAAATADVATANTQGAYNKINLDVARIQRVSGDFSAYGRFSGQWANKNLDSSEKFNLGGYYGVRAFPLGEGVGDRGWFAQLELRYAMGAVTPFVFYDYGKSDINAKPWDANSDATRKVGAAGVGARTLWDKWSLDATLGWRNQGGASTSENVDRNPRLFVMLGRRF